MNHTSEFMNELDESITDIDDVDKVHPKLKAIGARYKKNSLVSNSVFLVILIKYVLYQLRILLNLMIVEWLYALISIKINLNHSQFTDRIRGLCE